MFMSYIIILLFSFIIRNLHALPQEPIQTLKPTLPFSPIENSSPSGRCEGENCPRNSNLIGIILGIVSGIIVSVLISVFLIWFYFKRKHSFEKTISKIPEIKCIEHPSLYTGTISTTDSTSRLYGISPVSRTNSINSHFYEKINE